MANAPDDRARTRNDLRELAKLATPAPPSSHRFESADSSGYVDLSAFSANDASWVDRELARARAGAPKPPPLPPTGARPASSRTIDALSPESMAPVALEGFLVTDTAKVRRPSRARRAIYGGIALASVAGVAALALAVTRHAPAPAKAAVEAPTAAAAAAPPPADTTTATAAATATSDPAPQAASTAVAAAAATPTATPPKTAAASGAAATTTPPAAKKPAFTARAHAVAAAPASAPVHSAAAKPVVIPQSHAKSSGDALMDAIRNSVAKGK